MSLLDAFAHPCVLLQRTRVSDGAGGFTTAWAEGDEFTLYPAFDASSEAQQAEQGTVVTNYTGLADKAVALAYGGYFLDKTTDTSFRVTSVPHEREAPATASAIIRGLKCFTFTREALPT